MLTREVEPRTPGTLIQYAKASRRMALRGLWPEEIGSKSRRSYNFNRAALVYSTTEDLRTLYGRMELPGGAMSNKQAHQLMTRIEQDLGILEMYPPHDRGSPSRWASPSKWKAPAGGAVHFSKRRYLGRMPAGWRQAIVEAAPVGSEYYTPLLVMALTGVRPAELKKGVSVTITAQGCLLITIKGAKVSTTTGQPERRLWVRV